MSVIIDNRTFVTSLAAAKVMAYSGNDDPAVSAIVLGSARVELGDSGTDSVLAFIATDRVNAGQALSPCEGTLEKVKFSAGQAAMLSSIAKNAATAAHKLDKENECSIELTVIDSGSTLKVQTLTNGAPGQVDSRHFIPLQDMDEFPLTATIAKLASRGRDTITGSSGEDSAESTSSPVELEAGNVRVLSEDASKKKAAISSVYHLPVEEYAQAHPASMLILTCAGTFRAAMPAHVYSPDLDVDAPEVPVASSLAPEMESETDPAAA